MDEIDLDRVKINVRNMNNKSQTRKIDSLDIYDKMHIRRRPRMHINYKSTDKKIEKISNP